MTKTDLEAYIYASMSNYRSPSVSVARKLSDVMWRVYETLLTEDGPNQLLFIDECMANSFKNGI